MIVHLVLFRPRADLDPADRDALVQAFIRASREIPSIRRVRAGRRVTIGRGYEALMRTDYPYVALLEFDDLSGLRAYLEHPAHDGLARRFFDAFEDVLLYDYDLAEEAGSVAHW